MKDNLTPLSMKFPEWKPHRRTKSDFESLNRELRSKVLRNACSGFISKLDVRDYLLKRDGFKCKKCNSKENLTVDHVIPVNFFVDSYTYEGVNDENNLQILCKKCNLSRPKYYRGFQNG